MKSLKAILAATLTATALFSGIAVDAAVAQSGRPLRFIVASAPGGSLDLYARAFAGPMSRYLNQSIVVENISGAGGMIGVSQVGRAAPDGNTVLIHNLGFVTNPALYRNPPYNPVTDFDYVGAITFSTMVLEARPDLPVADLKQFVEYAKANGEKVMIGNGGVGGPAHLCSLLLEQATGTKLKEVPFKGAAPGVTALMGKQIDVMCDGSTSAAGPIADGQLKGLGVTSRQRLQVLSNLPAIAEVLPGFELSPWSAIMAPKNTNPEALKRLEAALQAAFADKELQDFFTKNGLQMPSKELSTSAGLGNYVKAESEKWSSLFRSAGVPYVD